MADPFAKQLKTIDSVIDAAAAITPDDNNDLPTVSRGLWVGSGGDINVVLANSTDPVLISNVPDGSLLPFRVKRVHATGTTATGLVALL